MTEAQTIAAPFAAAHGVLAVRRSQDPAWVQAHRKTAFARCAALPMPTRKDEEWKYTSLRSVNEGTFGLPSVGTPVPIDVAERLAKVMSSDDVTLVFVDGQLSQTMSRRDKVPAGVTITTLDQAFAKRPEVVRRHLANDAHVASALSGAFLGDGVLIEVGKNVASERRIHIAHLVTGAGANFPRHIIVLEAGASATVVESFIGGASDAGTASGSFAAAVTDLEVGAGAKLKHARLNLESGTAIHIGTTRATLARDAEMQTLSFSAGAKLARVDLDVKLTGPGANVRLAGLYLAKGEQHVDHHTTVDHMVPDATSSQLYKGIMDDKSRAVFNGKVFVRQDAQRTNAFQMNRNLLLSSEAEIDTKPELQIDADDVKCSHGAAIGQLDKAQLFYLQSRGLTQDEAQHLLAEAFAAEVLLDDHAGLAARLMPLARGYFA